jgi:hypothetical protein
MAATKKLKMVCFIISVSFVDLFYSKIKPYASI